MPNRLLPLVNPGTRNGRALDHVVVAVQDLQVASQQFEALGFNLTPRAQHNDEMGTSNRLIQLDNKTFIELLEVDRPNGVKAHDFELTPSVFSFGEHNKRFLSAQTGMSMLVFQTDDAMADIQQWQSLNIDTHAPYHFERKATLPDGSKVDLSFSLGFASSPDMPLCSFFVCRNGAPQHFWKKAFQQHANSAQGIVDITLCSETPERDADFVHRLFGGIRDDSHTGDSGDSEDGGDKRVSISLTDTQSITIATPEAVANIDTSFDTTAATLPRFAGITVAVSQPDKVRTIPAELAGGLFLNLVSV